MTADGPVPFSAFMDQALYAPGVGFYERGGRAGRREGSFLTSPEVGPLFGAVVARALDGWWRDLDRPDPFRVEDHGAGPGTLARAVLAAGPECGRALQIVLVERSSTQRQLHPAHLPHRGEWTEGANARAGTGPEVWSTATAPAGPVHVVIANELLDNLAFDLFARSGDGWAEVRMDVDGQEAREVCVAAPVDVTAELSRRAPAAPPGGRVPLQRAAAAWLTAASARAEVGGCIVVLDYASTTANMADRPDGDWLRTYAAHERGGAPGERIGAQDITAEVAVDQLADAGGDPTSDRSQAEALRAWGIDELVAEGRARWEGRSGPADLAALTARSRIIEADALLDPAGLGAHRVLEWRT